MTEWTPEATAYLDAYLRQVDILAKSQGDDVDEIVSELREHVTRAAEGEGVALITLDMLRKTLASVGTPEQVVSLDHVPTPPEENGLADRPSASPPRTIIIQQPPAIQQPPHKRFRSCLITAIIGIVFFAVVSFCRRFIAFTDCCIYCASQLEASASARKRTGSDSHPQIHLRRRGSLHRQRC